MRSYAKALEKYGRKGDTILAHISPREAAMLKREGGAGTRNPSTGLLEFYESDMGRERGRQSGVGRDYGGGGRDRGQRDDYAFEQARGMATRPSNRGGFGAPDRSVHRDTSMGRRGARHMRSPVQESFMERFARGALNFANPFGVTIGPPKYDLPSGLTGNPIDWNPGAMVGSFTGIPGAGLLGHALGGEFDMGFAAGPPLDPWSNEQRQGDVYLLPVPETTS